MVIAQASTTQSFHKTHRYAALRERSVAPKVIHSSIPQVTPIAADPIAAADAMAHRANKSDRVEKPCYHIALSVGEEDQLSLLDWQQLATKFLGKAGLGVENYQSVGYLHEDTEFPGTDETRPHIHLVVNRVGLDGRAADTAWDYYRFQSALRAVEAEMGLSHEPNSWERKEKRDTPGQVHRLQNHPDAEPSVRTQLQAAIDQARQDATSVDGITQFLERSGINVRVSDRGWSLALGDVAIAGYQLGRGYTLPAIEKSLTQGIEMTPDEEFFGTDFDDDFTDGGISEEIDDQSDAANEAADGRSGRYFGGLGMGSLLRQSLAREVSQQQGERAKVVRTAQGFMGYGERLVNQNRDQIDGLTIAGVGAVGVGATLGLGQMFKDYLDAAKQRERSERVQGFVDRLEAAGERTTALENRFGQEPPEALGDGGSPAGPSGDGPAPSSGGGGLVADPGGDLVPDPDGKLTLTEPESGEPPIQDVEFWDTPEEPGFDATEQAEAGDYSRDPVVDSVLIAGGRVDQLERIAGVTPPSSQLEIDPTLPIDQQLAQVEAAIGNLEERLDKLEGRAQALEERQASASMPGEAVAKTLSNYASARAEAYLISPDEPIQTKTMGTIMATEERVTIDDPDYGLKFEAVQGEGGWQLQTDELSPAERAKIADLPQSVEEYTTQATGKDVVQSLQQLAPTEFSRLEGGQVTWETQLGSGAIQAYTFDIANQADGTQSITGTDSQGQAVFASEISPEGVIKVSQADIPPEQVDGLADKVLELRQQPKARPANSPTPSADEQLSL